VTEWILNGNISAQLGYTAGFRQVGTIQKNPLGFLGRTHAKNPPGFKPGGFFTLSFSHVKKQMKT